MDALRRPLSRCNQIGSDFSVQRLLPLWQIPNEPRHPGMVLKSTKAYQITNSMNKITISIFNKASQFLDVLVFALSKQCYFLIPNEMTLLQHGKQQHPASVSLLFLCGQCPRHCEPCLGHCRKQHKSDFCALFPHLSFRLCWLLYWIQGILIKARIWVNISLMCILYNLIRNIYYKYFKQTLCQTNSFLAIWF